MTPEAFADRCAVRLLENLDPVGRAHFLASLSKEARERLGVTASANRRKQRDDLIAHTASIIAPGASANRAAIELETALGRYLRTGWRKHSTAGTRPLNEPGRSLHRLLELTDGKVPAARSIREKL